MRSVKIFLWISILLNIALLSIFAKQYFNNKRQADWSNLTVPIVEEKGYFPDGIMGDIYLPAIRQINGKFKLIERDTNFYLGYDIFLNVDHLDTSLIPEKFKMKPYVENGIRYLPLTIKEARYSISILFTLLDKDNFKLMEIESTGKRILSGGTINLKDFIETPIPKRILNLINNIKFEIRKDTCLNCSEQYYLNL